ncbi:MAG: AsmA family protein [Hyphomonadaceae bacterium]|nr:AsmA family protein [Hyphomonadaceae bacterium]
MKRLLIILGAVIAVLVAIVAVVPFLIPSSVYKAQIESAATKALGRDVVMKGEASLSIFPIIAARVDNVEVANPEGFTDPLMIEAGSLRASVKLMPLFASRVEIAQITLEDATVRLERLADGTANWEFGDGSDPGETPGEQGGSGFETGIERAALSNTAVYYRDWTTDANYALTEFNATARLTALDEPFSSDGEGLINGQAFNYNIRLETIAELLAETPVSLAASLGTIYGDYSYEGALTLAETPTLDGAFELSSNTIGEVLTLIGDQDLPIVASALESVRARGKVKGVVTDAALDFEFLTLAATGLDVDFVGGVQLGDTPVLNGTVDLNAADAQRLLKPGHDLIPILTLLGNVDLQATLSGPLTAPSLTGIALKQRGESLITDYTGGLSLAGDQPLDGALQISSNDPRAVLSALGTDIPPGGTLNRLDISGRVSGQLMAPTLSGATLTLDDTTAKGKVGADLRGATPRISADLQMPRLDLTPFLGSGAQQADDEPSLNEDWDDTPLDLAALKAMNATVTVAANEVIIDQITLQDALLNTRLDEGRLSAIFRQDDDRPGFRVFQGGWSGDLVLDASRSTPRLQIEALANGIAAQEMLTALTGFKNLNGLGDVHLNLSSEGNSLKALINGLDGKFESDLNDGALRGMNLTKLVQNASDLQGLMSGGGLTIASFQEAFSPNASTDFSKFLGNLDIQNGVATLTELNIDNPVIGVIGSGQINLGARTLDIRLTPRVDVQAAGAGSTIGVGDIPIPVRIYGSWSNVRFGLDSSAVQTELTSRLRNRAASEITSRIGGDAGNILGEIVGNAPGTETEEDPAQNLEDELRSRALGALFGNRDRDEDEGDEDTEPAPN